MIRGIKAIYEDPSCKIEIGLESTISEKQKVMDNFSILEDLKCFRAIFETVFLKYYRTVLPDETWPKPEHFSIVDEINMFESKLDS